MSGSQHTPGPWGMIPALDGVNVWIVGRLQPQLLGGAVYRPEIGKVRATCGPIVTAAPELLALVIQYRDDLRHPPSAESIERRLELINQVIAKAEGRS